MWRSVKLVDEANASPAAEAADGYGGDSVGSDEDPLLLESVALPLPRVIGPDGAIVEESKLLKFVRICKL